MAVTAKALEVMMPASVLAWIQSNTTLMLTPSNPKISFFVFMGDIVADGGWMSSIFVVFSLFFPSWHMLGEFSQEVNNLLLVGAHLFAVAESYCFV